MPAMTVSRTYEIPLPHPFNERERPEFLRARRRLIAGVPLSVGQPRLTLADARIVGFQEEDRFYVTITATEQRVRYEELDDRTLEVVVADIDSEVAELGRTLDESGEGSEDRYERLAFFNALSSLKDRTARRTLNAQVTIDVDQRVGAVIRSPRRCATSVEHAVIDYSSKYGRRVPSLDYGAAAVIEARDASIQITSATSGDAIEVARALVSAQRHRQPSRRVIDSWPRPSAPYWSTGTLVLAGFAVLLATAPVSSWALATTAIAVVVILAATLAVASRGGASVPATALGLAPAVLILAFAVLYGVNMQGRHPAIVGVTPRPHMVDAFLLSFGTASTSGFFDLTLRSTAVRVAAFIELLMMVSVAGGSAYAVSRVVWRRVTETLRSGPEG